VRPGAGRWALVAALAVVALAYITLNTLRTSGRGVGVPEGRRLPPFAVPRLQSNLEGDANVAARPGPGAGHSGRVPACAVRDPRALNLCRVAAGHPLALAFASVGDADSLRQLDAMQRIAPRFRGVRLVGLFLRGDRAAARRLAARRGWTFPLGFDRHGDVAAVYALKALPAMTFADAQRRSRGTVYRLLPAGELARRLRTLEAG
jgi:hypothetical protein